jgi:hypothetical protein
MTFYSVSVTHTLSSESQCIERQRVSAVAIQKSIHIIQKVSLSESECLVVSALGRPRAFLNFPLIDISLNLPMSLFFFQFNDHSNLFRSFKDKMKHAVLL